MRHLMLKFGVIKFVFTERLCEERAERKYVCVKRKCLPNGKIRQLGGGGGDPLFFLGGASTFWPKFSLAFFF